MSFEDNGQNNGHRNNGHGDWDFSELESGDDGPDDGSPEEPGSDEDRLYDGAIPELCSALEPDGFAATETDEEEEDEDCLRENVDIDDISDPGRTGMTRNEARIRARSLVPELRDCYEDLVLTQNNLFTRRAFMTSGERAARAKRFLEERLERLEERRRELEAELADLLLAATYPLGRRSVGVEVEDDNLNDYLLLFLKKSRENLLDAIHHLEAASKSEPLWYLLAAVRSAKIARWRRDNRQKRIKNRLAAVLEAAPREATGPDADLIDHADNPVVRTLLDPDLGPKLLNAALEATVRRILARPDPATLLRLLVFVLCDYGLLKRPEVSRILGISYLRCYRYLRQYRRFAVADVAGVDPKLIERLERDGHIE